MNQFGILLDSLASTVTEPSLRERTMHVEVQLKVYFEDRKVIEPPIRMVPWIPQEEPVQHIAEEVEEKHPALIPSGREPTILDWVLELLWSILTPILTPIYDFLKQLLYHYLALTLFCTSVFVASNSFAHSWPKIRPMLFDKAELSVSERDLLAYPHMKCLIPLDMRSEQDN